VRVNSVVKALLGIEQVVVDGVRFESAPVSVPSSTPSMGRSLVVSVRVARRASGRCPECGRRCRVRDQGEGIRRWRSLDLGSTRVFLEGPAPRVACRRHGVIVAAVPWARHGSRFTTAFEDQVAWLTCHTAKSTVSVLMRTSWRSVTSMVARVVADARAGMDRLKGLRRIGIDDKSYKKGHKYLMVVVDHDTGRVVWAKEGRDQDTVRAFFDELGEQRAAQLTHVSCDGATWIHDVIGERAGQAVICMDPFHVMQWASEAVDEVRRRITRDAKAAGQPLALGSPRWALLKAPDHLTGTQQVTLAQIKKTNAPLYRAYLIKEQLREVFIVKGDAGRALLAGVISWATRSRLPEMVKLAASLRNYQKTIKNTLDSGVTNGRVEATNTHIQTLINRAYGYGSAEALIAMIELKHGGLCPELPGR
jgi:transposase